MYQTNYLTAVNWLGNHRILCNTIHEVEEFFFESYRFDMFNEDGEPIDIYSYYLTDCSERDVEFLEQHFGLKFGYSEKLDMYVLCVDHYGTSWDYVYWKTDLECAERKLGER